MPPKAGQSNGIETETTYPGANNFRLIFARVRLSSRKRETTDLPRRKRRSPMLLRILFYIEGEGARADGLRIDDNPYERDTVQHEQWRLGWLDALPTPELTGPDHAFHVALRCDA